MEPFTAWLRRTKQGSVVSPEQPYSGLRMRGGAWRGALGDQLGVDTEALRSLAASLTGEADRISGIDPSGPIDGAAAAMPGSSVGAAAARAGGPLLRSYRDTAGRLREMAATAEANARAYDDADHVFRLDLDTTADL